MVEGRFKDDAFFTVAAELESVVVEQRQRKQQWQRNGDVQLLFDDGRVLPSASNGDVDDGVSTIGALCRFPVSLTGICSGRAG